MAAKESLKQKLQQWWGYNLVITFTDLVVDP